MVKPDEQKPAGWSNSFPRNNIWQRWSTERWKDFKSRHIVTYNEVNKVATEIDHNNKTKRKKENRPCFSRRCHVHPSAVEWVWEKASLRSPSVARGALQVHISPQNGWAWRYPGRLSAHMRNKIYKQDVLKKITGACLPKFHHQQCKVFRYGCYGVQRFLFFCF